MPTTRRHNSFRPNPEGLEPREALTGPASPVAQIAALATATGRVHKRPMFSSDYLGIKRSTLNLTDASVQLRPGRTLTLNATIAAQRIIARPRSAAEASFFVFGLDRGSPQSTPLFPTRPGIRFDSVVVARIEPGGITGYVLDIARGNIQTELDPARVRVIGRSVRVTIPDGILVPPDGSKPSTQTRYAVWVRSKLEHTLADIDDFVASFLPNNAMARVGVVRAGK